MGDVHVEELAREELGGGCVNQGIDEEEARMEDAYACT